RVVAHRAERPDEGVLGDFLGVTPIAEQPHGDREQAILVRGDEGGKGSLDVGRQPVRERRVGVHRPLQHDGPRNGCRSIGQEIVIVPFMLGCTEQWNGYVPALLKTRLLGEPLVMFAPMVHEPSSSATRCGTLSSFVQVITSPTLALTGWDQALFFTWASTTVVPVESEQTAAAGPVVAPAGAVVAVLLPEHAASA